MINLTHFLIFFSSQKHSKCSHNSLTCIDNPNNLFWSFVGYSINFGKTQTTILFKPITYPNPKFLSNSIQINLLDSKIHHTHAQLWNPRLCWIEIHTQTHPKIISHNIIFTLYVKGYKIKSKVKVHQPWTQSLHAHARLQLFIWVVHFLTHHQQNKHKNSNHFYQYNMIHNQIIHKNQN